MSGEANLPKKICIFWIFFVKSNIHRNPSDIAKMNTKARDRSSRGPASGCVAGSEIQRRFPTEASVIDPDLAHKHGKGYHMKQSSKVIIGKSAENDLVKMTIIDGIVHVQGKSGHTFTLEDAERMTNMRHQLQNYVKMPLLADLSGFKTWSKEARDFVSTDYAVRYLSAEALLLENSIFSATIANIYFKLSPPPIPHKAFNDREKAIEWLKKFL